MKLTQPAASSDVDEARAVAQRLGGSTPSTGPPETEPTPGFLVTPGEAPPAGVDTEPVEAVSGEGPGAPFGSAPDPMAGMLGELSEPILDPVDGMEGASSELTPDPLAGLSPGPPPPFDDPLAGLSLGPPPPFDDPLAGMRGASSEVAPDPLAGLSPGPPPPSDDPLAGMLGALSQAAPDPLAGLSPGPPAAPGFPDAPFPPAEADVSSGDPLGTLLGDAGAQPLAAPPAAPTWAQILQDCLRLARSRGALLMDSQGGVLESCGEWPAAGVAAVAGKLQPIVEKKHQEAPGTPVPLRLGSRVLTAWRVTIGAGMLTVALLGDSAPPPAIRAEVDSQLRNGALP